MGVGGNHLRRMTSDIERTHDHGTETCIPPSMIVSVVSVTKRWVQVLACSSSTKSCTIPSIRASGRTTGRPCISVSLRSTMMVG